MRVSICGRLSASRVLEFPLRAWRKALVALVAVLAPTVMFLVNPRSGAIGLIVLALVVVGAMAYRLL